jgi:hypothetical protein
MAAKIGVRLMDGRRYQELGLQYDQARRLAAAYIGTLRSVYGNSKPRAIAGEIFDALQREPTKRERGTLPGSSGPGGRSGPAGGTGSDVSGKGIDLHPVMFDQQGNVVGPDHPNPARLIPESMTRRSSEQKLKDSLK